MSDRSALIETLKEQLQAMERTLAELAGEDERREPGAVSLEEMAREVASARTPGERSRATQEFNRRYDEGLVL